MKPQKERRAELKLRNEIMQQLTKEERLEVDSLDITITGRIPSKKNSKQIVCRGKFPKVLPSKEYTLWHIGAMVQLTRLKAPKDLIEQCKVSIVIYFPCKRRADLTNKAESIMDLLVDYNVIKDDNWQCVGEIKLSGYYDKENPRAEISIEEI